MICAAVPGMEGAALDRAHMLTIGMRGWERAAGLRSTNVRCIQGPSMYGVSARFSLPSSWSQVPESEWVESWLVTRSSITSALKVKLLHVYTCT